jgi:hypothetical protein
MPSAALGPVPRASGRRGPPASLRLATDGPRRLGDRWFVEIDGDSHRSSSSTTNDLGRLPFA